MKANEVSFIDKTGARTEVEIDVTDYRHAADAKLSLTQYYERKYETAAGSPTALEQFAGSAGLRVKSDAKKGIKASSMKEVLYGIPDKSAGSVIVRDDGSNRHTPSGRILFPEVIMQMTNEVLIANKDDMLTPWENAIAIKSSIVGPRADQPLINVTAPESSAAMPIGQLSRPTTMVTISLNERSYTIPTKSIGLQVSDQALETTTIDLVALTLAAQARGERIRRIEDDMANIINGDTDFGINAVTFANASTFDAIGSNKITHLGWLKWLRANYQKMTITDVVLDLDSWYGIETRGGKPTVFSDLTSQANRLPGGFSIENAGIPQPNFLLLPTSIVGANRVVGFDRTYAMQQITNISAAYSAIEHLVMLRGTEMRFDYGTAVFKLLDEAFTGVTLGA